MRRFLGLCVMCVLPLGLPMASLIAGGDKVEAGYTLIFNGKDFAGWQPKGKKEPLTGKTEAFGGRFKVVGGSMVIDPAVKTGAYLETVREFPKDVVLKFDFKAGPMCNNDIFIRGTKFDIVPGNKENKTVKEGEWATCEIIVSGDNVEHKINGESARKSTSKEKAGPFIVRAEFGGIEIKNLRVKE